MAIPALIPTVIGYGLSGLEPPSQAEPWDVMVGGLRFMLAAGPNTPLVRRGAEYRNTDVNFSGEPGEVALGFWWQRSQSGWQLGAGAPTFDGPGSGTGDIASLRYNESFGVDPWTNGQLSLLKDVDTIDTASADAAELVAYTDASGDPAVAWRDGTAVKSWDGTTVTTFDPGPPDWQSICSDGTNLFYVDGDVVYYDKYGVDTTPYIGLTADAYLIRFAKQRLMLAGDNNLYELDRDQIDAALPTPLFTHPNPEWVWTDIVGGPGALYASGYAGQSSAVYKFVLEDDGGLPALTAGGVVACELPDGERVLCMRPYIGAFIALGTSAGLRVCSFAGTDIGLAPLTVENRGEIRSVTAWDRFLYASCDDAGEGNAGLVRVDLSAQTEFDRYAWAPDLRANTDSPTGFIGVAGTCNSTAMFDGRPVFIIPGTGVFVEAETRLVPSGYLLSGRILFGMADPKIFQRASVTTSGQGTVVLSTGTDSDEANIDRITIDTTIRNRLEADIGSTRGSTLTVGLALTRSAEDAGPIVLSWAVRALPSQPREEQLLIPVRCFDRVENRFGETQYGDAWTVLDQLSELVRYQTPVILQFFVGDVEKWRTLVVQVADFQFEQVTSEGSWGGIVTLDCRTVVGGS